MSDSVTLVTPEHFQKETRCADAFANPKRRRVDPGPRRYSGLAGVTLLAAAISSSSICKIQDRYGCCPRGNLVALADEIKMAMAEVYESRPFTTTSTIVKEGRRAARDHCSRLRFDRLRPRRFT